VRDPWRAHPLAWIHRVEARAIARELSVPLISCSNDLPDGKLLLRLSDPVMRKVVKEIRVPYRGPGSAALERCYDKYEAHRIVTAGGLETPETTLASAIRHPPAPLVLKPRRGSDSIGVRVVKAIPADKRNDDHIVQERVHGEEFTVALYRDRVGVPLRIYLPPGTPYSFLRKYLLRPRCAALKQGPLVKPIQDAALRIGGLLGVDWAARVDMILETATGRLRFLECDAAPLVGPDSAFAASFAAAGVARATQLAWLCE
jgi:D-alanine-D-alanine ligase-like ATP-grasp enzyme